MPNIGLSDKTFAKLNKIKEFIEKNQPAARPTYNGIVDWLINEHEEKEKPISE